MVGANQGVEGMRRGTGRPEAKATWWSRVVVALFVALFLVGCGAEPTPPTSAPSESPTPTGPQSAGAAEEPTAQAALDPVEILSRNVSAARSACAGCGGELKVDAATKKEMMDELLREHSEHQGPPLTRVNAEKSLYGPAGSTPQVAGQSEPAPDVSFRDQEGKEVYRREIKTFDGNESSFSKSFSKYAGKMKYRGEFYIQVKGEVDPKVLMQRFWDDRKGKGALDKYADVYAAFHDEKGRPLGLWMFGARGMGVPGG
ncbi:hypothetical protein O1Q96_16305 [Streptomyces sp. Qhu-G9]|uniref:hypothetical protein n=1 Tax=Streptomyces sp. Qhu-G9 TaxID=3452799 RepID=UPI0022AC8259|nr:hypothetical protein [Streptomyces aurantiacus]WAU81199.1 hypothetical protein O1Q96_16305 [Streptomyces aurantiacus]